MSWKDNLDEGAKKEVEQLEASIAERDQKLSNAGQELASNRTVKQQLEAERDALKVKLQEAEDRARGTGGQPTDTEAVVRRVLAENDTKAASQNRETAEARFISSHKEFASDADPGGVKFSAVKGKLARFNTDGLKTVEDFMGVYEEAYLLVNPARAAEGGEYAPYADSPHDTGRGPKETDTQVLAVKEKKLVERMGWTKEQYLSQKTKRPTYVKQLLEHME